MLRTILPLIQTLKSARETKKMTQRVLADKIGIPQSHLSKIESGTVDIQLTSFVEMARNLDLEVMLIPRQEISWVKNLVASKEKGRLGDEIKPAYLLDDEKENED